MNEKTAIYEKLFKLKAALSENKYIGLSSEFFSRRLLDFFFEQEVYSIDELNFLKKMFNKKDKSKITDKQQRKINYHIISQIIPYLRDTLS